MSDIKLIDIFGTTDIGSRHSGKLLREKIEPILETQGTVTLDFSDIDLVTQSFVDEFVGVLIRRSGMSVLSNLRFKNCNNGVKGIIKLVASYSLDLIHSTETNVR